ncbi:M48 family metalloprotease, partial [bacterium]|nr:M48 family metalloprotease [bacterium]
AFTRDEERMADNLGLDLMIRANLDPHGFIEVFQQMQNITGAAESKINPNRINHPLTSERLKNIRDAIAARGDVGDMSQTPDAALTARYDLVRAKLIGYLDTPARVATLYPAGDKSDAAIYARAIANMRGGNLDAALMGARTLVARAPKNPYFYELLGDAAYRYGYYDDAVDAYTRSLDLMAGDAPQIQTALAMTLVERNRSGDASRAIELCRRVLLGDAAPLTYWVLARAYGDDARADWARAEYYQEMGDKKQAKTYATRALRALPKSSPEYIKSDDILRSLASGK